MPAIVTYGFVSGKTTVLSSIPGGTTAEECRQTLFRDDLPNIAAVEWSYEISDGDLALCDDFRSVANPSDPTGNCRVYKFFAGPGIDPNSLAQRGCSFSESSRVWVRDTNLICTSPSLPPSPPPEPAAASCPPPSPPPPSPPPNRRRRLRRRAWTGRTSSWARRVPTCLPTASAAATACSATCVA